MSDPIMDRMLAHINAGNYGQPPASDSVAQGIIIGRREMKPLIRELIEELEDFQLEHSYNRKKEALVARAKEVLENG